jgi:hypothetical protein
MKRKNIIFILFFIFLLNSCIITTTASMREEIIKNNSSVTNVGIIFDWTNSDNKYIALELKLEGERNLFLTFVNWRKKPNREPFYLSGIGNYAFTQIYHFVDKNTKETYEVVFNKRDYYKLPYLSRKIGIQLKTTQDLIKYYDDIYAFFESLPLIKNEDDFKKMLEEGKLINNDNYETEKYFVKIYYARDIWNDEYYGKEWIDGKSQPRKPDYDSNERIIDYYLW